MRRTFLFLLLLIPVGVHAERVLDLRVDAREFPRRLLSSEVSMELEQGESALLYPKWVPGIHAPRGPIENVAGFSVTDERGNDVEWTRDAADPFRFLIDVPESGRYTVSIRYITNQPSVNSRSIDSYGYPNQGVLNWNTVLVYPEGVPVRDIDVRTSLRLPDGWAYGSALEAAGESGGEVRFDATDLEDLVDKPLIAGAFLKTIELARTDSASWFLHVSADEARFVPEESDSLITPIRDLCVEAELLFGRTHFDSYHFLLALSDALSLGVEHRNSSLNSDDADTFMGKAWIETGIEVLLPHEVAHAWCGKYRRPAGMFTDHFHETKDTELLWVYEGLDEYAEKLLTARCGFRTLDMARQGFAYNAALLKYQKGRGWRPLSDTAKAAWTLRGGSTYWTFLRRGQDYYNEGSFIWLEVDARIRELTGGAKSLDDFMVSFFSAGDPDAHAVPFDRAEIVSLLNEIAPYDWEGLFAERVDAAPGDEIPRGLELVGWPLGWTEEKPEIVAAVERMRSYSRLYDSIGTAVDREGKIGAVIPGSPVDRAGLLKGDEILGVGDRRFTSERLVDAVRDSKESGRIDLLVDRGGRLERISVEYEEGLRFYTLERDESRPDLLTEILRPRRAN